MAVEAEGCDDPALDVTVDAWAASCTPDPLVVVGPVDVLAFVYRGPRPADAARLSLGAELIDATLEPVGTSLRLLDR
jgi:hypothetical protein